MCVSPAWIEVSGATRSPFLALVGFIFSLSSSADCIGDRYRFFDALLGEWDEYQISSAGRKHLGALIFDIPEDAYYVADEGSFDGGTTWSRLELVHTIRRIDPDTQGMTSE
jgi:hypothetical protein